MAVDKVLWTFLVADGVFVLCGALLLTVALISKSNIQSEITMDNIAELLLLENCPLNGSSTLHLHPRLLPVSIWSLTRRSKSSRGRKRSPHLHNLRPLDPRYHSAREPQLAQIPRLDGRCLRAIHARSRSEYLVRDVDHTIGVEYDLGGTGS
jgi:hypothetical protein